MNTNKNDLMKIPLVCDLDLNQYLGKWYEIGKLPASGQNGLDNVTATYTMRKNGKIRVENAGYKNGKKKGIKGSAWLRDEKCGGGLYVQFFWPFKGDYNIIRLAEDYRYALVMGDSRSSLWILSRTPKLIKSDLREILSFLKAHSFRVERITKTKQDGNV